MSYFGETSVLTAYLTWLGDTRPLSRTLWVTEVASWLCAAAGFHCNFEKQCHCVTTVSDIMQDTCMRTQIMSKMLYLAPHEIQIICIHINTCFLRYTPNSAMNLYQVKEKLSCDYQHLFF